MSASSIKAGDVIGVYTVLSAPRRVTAISKKSGREYRKSAARVACNVCGTEKEIDKFLLSGAIASKCTCKEGVLYRIMDKATVSTSGCWEIPTRPGRYPSTYHEGRDWPSHRLVYYLLTGDLPTVVRHTCDNMQCVNPWHLLPGTHADNAMDRVLRDRRLSSKLKVADVIAIKKRLSYGEGAASISKDYGVTRPQIQHIKSGIRWSHVQP